MTTTKNEPTTPRGLNMSNEDVGKIAPSALLADVVIPSVESLKTNSRLYFCGISDDFKSGFSFQIRVAGVVFSSESFWWSGSGETAQQRRVSGSVQRLTDAQIARLKELLPHQWLRRCFNKATGLNDGWEHVDSSDSGIPPKPIHGRLHGDEIPLRNVLVFRPYGGTERALDASESAVSAEDRKRIAEEAEREEAEDLMNEHHASDAKDPLASRRTRARRDATTTTGNKTGTAGLLG